MVGDRIVWLKQHPLVATLLSREFWFQPVHFRFSMQGMLVMVALVSVGLGWTSARGRWQREQALRTQQRIESDRWWLGFTAAQEEELEADAEHRHALRHWPRLAQLEQEGVYLRYASGNATALSFLTQPHADEAYIRKVLYEYREELSSLELLGLENSQATDGLIEQLAASPLKILWLDHCGSITDAAIEALQRMKSLEQLRIVGTGITPAGVERLRAALPECLVIETESEPFEWTGATSRAP